MIAQQYIDKFYPNEQFNGTLIFYKWIREYTHNKTRMLNLGAGPASKEKVRSFKGEVECVIGVDIDDEVLGNEDLDESYLIENDRLPFEDSSFDVVISDYVLEHVEKPEQFLSEVYRVLRPEGHFLFRTPNKYHYVALIAKLTPHWFHLLVANRTRGLAEDSHDPYPTFYRINSKKEINKLSYEFGFSQSELKMIECEPATF